MIVTAQDPHQLEMSLDAYMSEVDLACKKTRELLVGAGLEGRLFDVILVLREALNNAIRHGNRCTEGKRVSCRCRLEGNDLAIEIEDEGEGFDWMPCLDRQPEAVSECGRGMSIMRMYTTSMEFNGKGNRLTLRMRMG
ncbi:MAG: ATP-binding protein [Acidobacteriota bacterium]